MFRHVKNQIGQSSTDSTRLQGPSKEQALTSCIQSLLSKNAIERVENLNLSGFTVACFLYPSLTKMETSNRPKQAQHLPTCGKVQNRNTRVHQGRSDSRGMGVVDRPIRRLPSHLHSPKLKEVPKVLSQVTSFQFTSLPSGWPRPLRSLQ